MPRNTKAFTRLELLAVLVVLALLAAVAWPLLAADRSEAERAVCANNLRRLGLAVASWQANHTGEVPWLTPVADGGTRTTTTRPGVAWVEMLSLSNELASPRLLACPADASVKSAEHWGSTANGFANTGFRQNALSYFLGLHPQMDSPSMILAADRNVEFNATGASCAPASMNNAAVGYPGGFRWTNGLHSASFGHVLLLDGRVAYLSSASLSTVEARQGDNYTGHFLPAR